MLGGKKGLGVFEEELIGHCVNLKCMSQGTVKAR